MPTAKRKKIKKRTKYTAFGACVILLALVGIVAVIVLAVNTTVKVLDDSEQKAEFEKYLAPVVMFDPVAFESIDKASEKMLLESSLWATLMNMDSNKYNYDDMQMLVVNQTDVDAACAKLFGKDVKLDHQSFGETQMNFIYQSEDKTYHIPVMGVTNMYTPKVEKITKRAGKYILKVGYIAPDSDWTIDPVRTFPPEKARGASPQVRAALKTARRRLPERRLPKRRPPRRPRLNKQSVWKIERELPFYFQFRKRLAQPSIWTSAAIVNFGPCSAGPAGIGG